MFTERKNILKQISKLEDKLQGSLKLGFWCTVPEGLTMFPLKDRFDHCVVWGQSVAPQLLTGSVIVALVCDVEAFIKINKHVSRYNSHSPVGGKT